eukprot:1194302-Prorocentrum_minimum.AAC.15
MPPIICCICCNIAGSRLGIPPAPPALPMPMLPIICCICCIIAGLLSACCTCKGAHTGPAHQIAVPHTSSSVLSPCCSRLSLRLAQRGGAEARRREHLSYSCSWVCASAVLTSPDYEGGCSSP